ncbi:ImmA/IrrE family metallo-endopeptidase [Zhihengliuella flava]|uniref:Zn-dependent peptidase ImmA (M78 family) n=1 Tax=Zhihengliuella flava TaxID=1285193 RepID=A0A931GMX8_9MICC|nr:ImmA/IrrE family metallo-endopeptidase [Zhihengliuella flava]MBG6085864.1 Zn-dependent peptidase ImmA (M78 family) [Zhihengliuella flava]
MFDSLLGRLGIRVIEEYLPDGWWGAYDWYSRTIYLRPGLAPVQRRSTLAHECAHAVLDHHGHHPRNETAAKELAASWLITREEFMLAAKAHGTVQAAAHELGVLPRDIKAFQRILEKEGAPCVS